MASAKLAPLIWQGSLSGCIRHPARTRLVEGCRNVIVRVDRAVRSLNGPLFVDPRPGWRTESVHQRPDSGARR